MKKIKLIALGLLIVSCAHAQTLYTANNNPGAQLGLDNTVFIGATALQDAFAASVANDIIYLVPSPVTYGSLNITHAITIFGVGIRPSKDLGAKSLVGLINIDADNVRLSGLVNSTESNAEIKLAQNSGSGNIDGITIENCRVDRIWMGPNAATISNLMIRNNVITGAGSVVTHLWLKTTSNAIVTNNIMIGGSTQVNALNATFTYNVFANTQNGGSFNNVDDCFFDHNIFYGVRVDIPASSTGNSWTNNLCFGNTVDSRHVFNVTTDGNNDLGAPGSNIESVSGSNDPLFLNFPQVSSWNDSYDLTLQAGSPALNVNGEDIGPSGGTTPFDFEGNVLPLIQSVTVPAVIPFGTNLPVTIKAKGN